MRQEFILRVKPAGKSEYYIGRRYGEFARLHKRIRTELPGKVLAPLPRKNKVSSSMFGFGGDDDDASSVSSVDTTQEGNVTFKSGSMASLHARAPSIASGSARSSRRGSPRPSTDLDGTRDPIILYREEQRVSLRAFLRTFLQNQQIADTKAMKDFLSGSPIRLNQEELLDVARRKEMDRKRIEEQRQFYDIARQRAKELDVYMERFRRDIVESSKPTPIAIASNADQTDGLSKLFAEIRVKEKIEDLTVEYKKFAEWLRIEYVRPCSNNLY